MEDNDKIKIKGLDMIALNPSSNKKNIGIFAKSYTESQIEEGFIDVGEQLVIGTRILTFFEERINVLRKAVLIKAEQYKNTSQLGAKLELMATGGKWEFSDPYILSLEEELKVAKEKAKQVNAKDRVHITLAGEQITLTKGIKIPGGETIKVTL